MKNNHTFSEATYVTQLLHVCALKSLSVLLTKAEVFETTVAHSH